MESEPEVTDEVGADRRGDRFADATGRGVAAGARGVIAVGRGAGRLFRFARTQARADGAGDSGLYRLIELHAFNAAGDAAFAVSLAGTIFFSQPGQARGPVLLFLGLTMVPFSVIAPLLGPFLDRFSHGRRWAIGFTFAFRAFMCWVMAGVIASHPHADSPTFYATALGALIASKAYGIARAATVPRLVPPDQTLVKANSRISLAGIVGAAVSAPLAALAAHFGGQWSLRYAFVVFVGGTVLSILLPAKSDATAGEEKVGGRQPFVLPASIVFALRCNVGLRLLSGFLTMFMAFVLINHPFDSWHHSTAILLGLVLGAAGLGNTAGIGLSAVLRRINPAVVVVIALVADAAMMVVAALFYGLVASVALGLTIGTAQAMGKLSLDATIQRDVDESYRTSAFARSETVLQLSWVVGGFLGVLLSIKKPELGLFLVAAITVAWTVVVLVRRSQPLRRPTAPVAPASS
ncbi:MAG: MFS transporter [Marmoricola sp.]